jgi:hypothetical protein
MQRRNLNAKMRGKAVQKGAPRALVGKLVVGRPIAVDKKRGKNGVGLPAYRSGLERRLGDTLKGIGVEFEYEPCKFEYVVPEKKRKYLPDFKLGQLYVETKGRFTAEDRAKMVLVLAQNPDLQLLMVFSDSNKKIRKGSKTSYADWCAKAGIPFCNIGDFERSLKEKYAHKVPT